MEFSNDTGRKLAEYLGDNQAAACRRLPLVEFRMCTKSNRPCPLRLHPTRNLSILFNMRLHAEITLIRQKGGIVRFFLVRERTNGNNSDDRWIDLFAVVLIPRFSLLGEWQIRIYLWDGQE